MKLLSGLKIAIASPKKSRKTSKYKRESNNLITALVIEDENNELKASIDTNKIGIKEVLNFTDESFELKDRISIFSKQKDDNGKRIRFIRDVWSAKFFPGLKENYIPFNKNWLVKGYVVTNGLNKLFDFKELIGIKGYINVDTNEYSNNNSYFSKSRY